jgi:pimeloyl-ACP methyl ester carboxylesterase
LSNQKTSKIKKVEYRLLENFIRLDRFTFQHPYETTTKQEEIPMSRTTKLSVAYLAALALLLGGSLSAQAGYATDPAFYQNVPADLSAYQRGDIIRVEENVQMDDSIFHGAPGTAIMYVSEDDLGNKFAATQMVFFPTGATNPDGTWDVVIWAHGTDGIADRCAASRYESLSFELSIYMPQEEGYRWKPYGAVVRRILDQNYVVVAPDYAGIGPEDGFNHYYIVKQPALNSTIDAVIAARNYSSQVGTDFVSLGHSYGGIIGTWLNEAGTQIPEPLSLKGVVSVAGGANVASIFEILSDISTGGYPYLHYVDWGIYYWAQDHGKTYDHADLLGPDLLPQVDATEEACWDDLFGSVYAHLAVTPEGVLNPNAQANLEAIGYFDAIAQSLDFGSVPHFSAYSRQDPLGQTTPAFLKDLCREGNTVVREVRNFTHDQMIHSAELFNNNIWPWVADRFADLPAPNECSEILAE